MMTHGEGVAGWLLMVRVCQGCSTALRVWHDGEPRLSLHPCDIWHPWRYGAISARCSYGGDRGTTVGRETKYT